MKELNALFYIMGLRTLFCTLSLLAQQNIWRKCSQHLADADSDT